VPLVTKPPARLTEATLLSAMEGAGKLIEDDDLREAMREKGLGTPATRAQIIEGLIFEKYVHREGRELIPTAKAFSLIVLLRGLGIPELFSPELTAEWEYKLAQMQHGKLDRKTFMAEIVDITRHIVGQAKNHESDTIPGDFATLKSPCPRCGGVIKENYKKFQCQACDFSMWKIIAGRQLEEEEAEQLLTLRRVGPLEGFRSKQGRPFSAELKLNDALEAQFDFGEPSGGDNDEAPDFSDRQPVGPCPKCGNKVYEHGTSYVCEKSLGPDKSCDFRSGRMILQRPIELEQMQKLLATGKTDLLTKFTSKKGRPFSAFLVRKPDGTIGFEFEQKTAKSGAKGAAKTGSGALRELGAHPDDEQPVVVMSGRYGPYVKHGKTNATLPAETSVESITLEEALDLIAAKTGTTRPAAGKAAASASAAKKPTAKKPVTKAKKAA
jgi:DNA topoisomerase-3